MKRLIMHETDAACNTTDKYPAYMLNNIAHCQVACKYIAQAV